MTTQTILIVEDEPRLASLEADYLRTAGFLSHILDEGSGVVDWVRRNKPALVLLDLMLPGRDGLEICRELRGFSTLPIIMVTARVEEIDRLLGLELGADDYISKPFSPREMVARVKAVLRRGSMPVATADGPLSLDPDRQIANVLGRSLELTTVEFRLLQTLVAEPGRIYSRQQLMDRIYMDQRVVSDRTIDSHIKKLRRRLAGVLPETELIHSVYGAGYKYDPRP